jgi:hypothetical protein
MTRAPLALPIHSLSDTPISVGGEKDTGSEAHSYDLQLAYTNQFQAFADKMEGRM